MVLLSGGDTQPLEKKQVNVVFRYDDYAAKSPTDMELKIINAFRSIGASLTVGVIPFVYAGDVHDPSPGDVIPLTPRGADILKSGSKDGTLDIALHGYSHQTINAKRMTEFEGLDYNRQLEKLTKGKEFLEGMIDAPVTTFVPPWNTYDLNTLRALEQLGFSTLSASMAGAAVEDSKLNFLPATCGLSQLRDAVETARASADPQPVIVVLFHASDFKINDYEKRGIITYPDFCDLLKWLKRQREVRLLSISQATEVMDLNVNRFLWNKRAYILSRLLPPPFEEREAMLYRDRPALPILKVGGFYLAILILGIALSLMVGLLVFPRSAFIMNIGTFGSILLAVVLLVYALHDFVLGPKGLMVGAGAVGTSTGLYVSFLHLRKHKNRLADRCKRGKDSPHA